MKQGTRVVDVTSAPTLRLFKESIEPQLFELPSQALVSWRSFKAQRPALVILADQPYLEPIPASLQAEALKMLIQGSDQELLRRADFDQPDPLNIAPQAVRAALMAGLFREVVWLLPDDRPLDEFSWQIMNQQLRMAGLLGQDEELKISDDGGIARTRLGATPLTLVHPDAWSLLHLQPPAVLHLDLSYFKSAYRSEARIPVYDMLMTVTGMLRGMELDLLAVTLSYSTLDGYVDLGGRFTLPAMAALIRQPDRLDKEIPKPWKLRARALNKLTLFEETEASVLYHELLALTPDDPAALYDVATRMFHAQQFSTGVKLIDRTVAIDPGYAVMYLDLAEKARQAGDLNNAELLLNKYRQLDPQHPGIMLRLAELYKSQGRLMEAQTLIAELEKLPWSPIYHGDLPELLEQMRKEQ